MSIFFSKPTHDEIELTILGTGGGYGESIVMKIGESNWIIIDSCIDPVKKEPLSIEYLTKIGVDFKEQVKLVICTHWHNDHILGLSKTLNYCENAKFCMPQVNDTGKFLRYVGFDSEKNKRGSISSLNEFGDCIDIAKTRNIPIKRAASDKILINENFTLSNKLHVDLQLIALSPSDSVVANFDLELATLLDEFKISKISVAEKSANEKSMVLYLRYGDFSALLGADLEIGKTENEGWRDIDKNSLAVNKKSFVYKVPHHASENGYDKEIYEKLVMPDAILKISPWNRNSKLPTPEMLAVYKSHSANVYITSPILCSNKPKKREKQVEKLIELFSRKVVEVKFSQGIIRTRHNLVTNEIATQLYGNAFKV